MVSNKKSRDPTSLEEQADTIGKRLEQEHSKIEHKHHKRNDSWIFLILAIIIFLGLTIYVVSFLYHKEKPQHLNNPDPINEGVQQRYIDTVSRSDIKGCDRFTGFQKWQCQYMINLRKGNESFCKQKPDMEKPIYYQSLAQNKSYRLSPQSQCWIEMSFRNSINYCGNLVNIHEEDMCSQDFAIKLGKGASRV